MQEHTLEHAANIVRKRAINNFARVSLGVLASQIYETRVLFSRKRRASLDLSSWLLNKFPEKRAIFPDPFGKILKKEGAGKRRGGEKRSVPCIFDGGERLELFSIINQCHASLVVAAVESATRTTFTMTDDVRNYLLSGRGGGRNGSEKTAVERNYGRAGETMITRTICCWGGGAMIRPISTTISYEINYVCQRGGNF